MSMLFKLTLLILLSINITRSTLIPSLFCHIKNVPLPGQCTSVWQYSLDGNETIFLDHVDPLDNNETYNWNFPSSLIVDSLPFWFFPDSNPEEPQNFTMVSICDDTNVHFWWLVESSNSSTYLLDADFTEPDDCPETYWVKGACCEIDLDCKVLTESECNSRSGKFLGNYTTCGADKCGACYHCDGTCSDAESFDECEDDDSSNFFEDLPCKQSWCFPRGACCKPDCCEHNSTEPCCFPDQSEITCILGGGEFLGICSKCDNESCVTPQPTPEFVPTPEPPSRGSCCGCNGTCVDNTTIMECSNLFPLYHFRPGITCDNNETVCTEFGSCCIENEQCFVSNEPLCIIAGGNYLGSCSDCSGCNTTTLAPTLQPTPEPVLGTCCTCRAQCIENITEFECSQLEPVYTWEEGVTCFEINCIETGACCFENGTCIPNINIVLCENVYGGNWPMICTDCDICNTTIQPTPEFPTPPLPFVFGGACCGCDGFCIDGITEEICTAVFPEGSRFTNNATCSMIEPPCDAFGACCLTNVSECPGTNFTEEQCFDLGPDAFYLGDCSNCSLCEDMQPTPAPTPEELVGSCCVCNGSCYDNITENECDNISNFTIFSDTKNCSEPPICQEFGACCFQNEACLLLDDFVCETSSGEYLGTCAPCDLCNTTTLAPTSTPTLEPTGEPTPSPTSTPTGEPTSEPTPQPTPENRGTCCTCFKECIEDVTESTCILHYDGNFMGPNTTCGGPNKTECGSCCNCTGDCSDNVSWEYCMDSMGDNNCAKFVALGSCYSKYNKSKCSYFGACCVEDTCIPQTNQEQCMSYGGIYQGNCTTCEINICLETPAPTSEPTSSPTIAPTSSPTSSPTVAPTPEQPTGQPTPFNMGGCCYGDPEQYCEFYCNVTTREICENELWGNYMGDGILCGQDRCGACCKCEGHCVDKVSYDWCELEETSLFHKEQKCFDVKCKEMGSCCIWTECFPYESEYSCESQYGEYLGTCTTCDDVVCSVVPTFEMFPTSEPTSQPTPSPTFEPLEPTSQPTSLPTLEPSEPTLQPTSSPTLEPSEPTEAPTQAPTEAPTQVPTEAPTQLPTEAPTEIPTQTPTDSPTGSPTPVQEVSEPQTTGSCCHCDGTCTDDVTQGSCDTLIGGVFNALLGCHEATCLPRGACCVGVLCTPYLTEPLCLGNYQGDCVSCDGLTCPITLFSTSKGVDLVLKPEETNVVNKKVVTGSPPTMNNPVLVTRSDDALTEDGEVAACCVEKECLMTSNLTYCKSLGGLYLQGLYCDNIDCAELTNSGNDTGLIISVSVIVGVTILILLCMGFYFMMRSPTTTSRRPSRTSGYSSRTSGYSSSVTRSSRKKKGVVRNPTE